MIEKCIFRPTSGKYAIRIDNHDRGRIVIRDCLFFGPNGTAKDGMGSGNGGGVLAWQSSDIEVRDCFFEAIEGFCVRIMGSKTRAAENIRITGNRMVDLQADCEKGTDWGWQADGIQFIRVSGANSAIRDNPASTGWAPAT